MVNLFLSLCNRSAAAGWLILAVVMLRLVLKKAPKSVHCLLWLLVGVRLVCPFTVESALSLIPSAETIPQTVFERDALRVTSGVAPFNSYVNERLVDYYETTALPAGHTQSAVSICAAIWLTGLLALCLWALTSWLRITRQVSAAVPEGDGVWLCGNIASPFLLGLVRPRIYLPAGLDAGSRIYVLAHERAHIRRRDHWVKPSGFLLLAIYWFNPLLWLAYALLCRDIELACDEQVIRTLGPESKKSYSQALLQCSAHQRTIAACPLAFGEIGVKERVKNVLHYKKPAFWIVAASLAAVIAAAVCFLTDPAADRPDPVPPSSNLRVVTPGEGAPEYTGGALLYQSPLLSSYFSDSGGLYASVIEEGDILIMTDSQGVAARYTLEDTKRYTVPEFYQELDSLADEEQWMNRRLLPEDVSGIVCRTYLSEEPNADSTYSREIIWEITRAGGGKRMWIGGRYRLFALLESGDFMQPGWLARPAALWTYDPSFPTAIPVRFELESGASVWTSSGTLALDPRGGEWTDSLVTVEAGQTIYWMPDGMPEEGAALSYSYYTGAPYGRRSDSISLRSGMDYEGLYGGKTYGISQDWLGVASSRFHETWIETEGGGLVVRRASPEAALQTPQSHSIYGAPVRDSVVWDTVDSGQ